MNFFMISPCDHSIFRIIPLAESTTYSVVPITVIPTGVLNLAAGPVPSDVPGA